MHELWISDVNACIHASDRQSEYTAKPEHRNGAKRN